MTTGNTAKKAAPRRTPKVSNGDVVPDTRIVVTSDGTKEVTEVSSPETAKEVAKQEVETAKLADLEIEELRSIAEFFVKDVDPVAGKAEVLAALASAGPDGEEPVTWDDYENLYLPAQPPKSVDTPQKEAGPPVLLVVEADVEDDLVAEPEVLIKMERKNPRYDVAGYTFTKDHPFNSVPEKTAEFIIQQGGFRAALPSEVRDYYN